jgi:hypothetical protein
MNKLVEYNFSLNLNKNEIEMFIDNLQIIYNVSSKYLEDTLFSHLNDGEIKILSGNVLVDDYYIKQTLNVNHIYNALNIIIKNTTNEKLKQKINDIINKGIMYVINFEHNNSKPIEYEFAKEKLNEINEILNAHIIDDASVVFFSAFFE